VLQFFWARYILGHLLEHCFSPTGVKKTIFRHGSILEPVGDVLTQEEVTKPPVHYHKWHLE
jgi:hypothetical protein